MNLQFDTTNPAAVQMASNLIDLAGGMDQFQSATNSYFNEFFTQEERQQIELAASAAAVDAWTATLTDGQLASLNSDGGFRTLIESLDLMTVAGQEAFVAALDVQDSFIAVRDSGQTTSDIINNLPPTLEGAFTTMTGSAVASGDALVAANGNIVAANDAVITSNIALVASNTTMSQELLNIDAATNLSLIHI